MNRTKIDWCDHTWNPFVGCSNGCEWCYARKMAKRIGAIIGCEKCSRFEFHHHPERMDAPLKVKKPSIVFLGSMCDLFCDAAKGFLVTGGCGGFEGKYRTPAVFVRQWATFAPQHQYVVLTKRPENIPQGWNDDVPNLWVGVSVTGGWHVKDWERDATLCDQLFGKIRFRRLLCLEPLLGNVMTDPFENFHWLIVGGLTGHRRELHWDAMKRIVLIGQQRRIPVYLKRNLSPEVPMEYVMAHRQYPPELAEGKEQGDGKEEGAER